MNRTASLHHESLSDSEYAEHNIDPLPSTLATLDLIRRQNAMIEAQEARLGRVLTTAEMEAIITLDTEAAELREARQAWASDEFEKCILLKETHTELSDTHKGNKYHVPFAQAYRIAAGILAAQL